VRNASQYSWWDCLLLASALDLGCTHFLSDDLQDGHQIAGLTIIDPFAHTPQQILASL
jgi:predicted nucleic acid-binding protein